MKAFFEEYGGAIITVTVIASILGILAILLATNGAVRDAIVNLINVLLNKAGATPITVVDLAVVC